MKILVISLLRIGDLILQRPLLAALKSKYPGASLHVLANRQFESCQNLLTEVDQFHYFDRNRLQQMLGTAEVPLLRPCLELENLVDELNDQGFAQLYNFTHNRLSGHFASAIEAGEKFGLIADGSRFQSLQDPWLRFFNDRFGDHLAVHFHYSEILAHVFRLGNQAPNLEPRANGAIYIQPLTSDEKKNWGLSYFRQLVDLIYQSQPHVEVRILGAEFERTKLKTVFNDEELLICSMSELQEKLKNARLLISLDTSVKHLAAQSGVPILELALGSADPLRTAAFANNGIVMHAAVRCAPCGHSSNCRQMSHLCGENLHVDQVFNAVNAVLQNDQIALQNLAKENSVIKIYRSRFHAQLGWSLESVLDQEQNVLQLIDKITWALTLEAEREQGLAPVATAAIRIYDQASGAIDEAAWSRIQKRLHDEEQSLAIIANGIEKVLEESAKLCISSNFDMNTLQTLRASLARVQSLNARVDLFLRPLTELSTAPFATPFHFFGVVRKKLADLRKILEIRKKLIQCLSQIGGEHGKRNRQLSERSIATT